MNVERHPRPGAHLKLYLSERETASHDWLPPPNDVHFSIHAAERLVITNAVVTHGSGRAPLRVHQAHMGTLDITARFLSREATKAMQPWKDAAFERMAVRTGLPKRGR